MLSPSLRYIAFTGIEWSFQMKDLGFNEFGELASGGDEESALSSGAGGGSVELSAIKSGDGPASAE